MTSPTSTLNIFGSPSRYMQGAGATRSLAREMGRLGLDGPVLILASPRMRDLLEAVWTDIFEAAGQVVMVRTFGGECSGSEIEAGIAAARAFGAAVIVGSGGGKCLDTGRAVASELGLPVVNCPSIASSDAPCSALSVVYTDAGIFDHLQYYPKNPELVLVDTELVAKAPVRFLVSGMGDALATWFEARTVAQTRSTNELKGTPTLTAGAIARLCHDVLIADGLAALERVVEANTLMSGLGFESGGLALAHSVHNGLTAAPGTHSSLHGEKVAFGLLVQLVVEGQPTEEIDRVIAFCQSVGLPTTLEDVGLADLDDATLAAIAERTVAEGESSHHEPFEVTASLVSDGILAADALGRAAF